MSSDSAQESQFLSSSTINLILNFAWALMATRRFNYAAFTVMIWDLILTFPEEVTLIWSSRLTPVKLVFLFNRYASPLVIAINLWMLSGSAAGLSNSVYHLRSCRGWFSVAFIIQLICTTFVSILISFRLWAWYGMSSKSLYILSLVWMSSFFAAFGLLLYHVWARDYLIYDSYFNTCDSHAPAIWTQWLPGTLEHGFYFCFLLIGAMSTPRSAQTPALAVLYRDGILFYLTTFMAMLTALLVWAVASSFWLSIALFSPWIILQMATSRLLLDVKTHELFEGRYASASNAMVSNTSPLGGVAMTHPVDATQSQRENHTHSSFSYNMNNVSQPSFHQTDKEHHSDRRSSLHVYTKKTNKRFWWMFRRTNSDTQYIHVDMAANDERGAIGGVKDSRLGRFDSWLW